MKTALVTGATSGIGQQIAREVARAGLRVVLVGRSEERLARAVAEIRAEVAGAALDTRLIDLSSQASIREFAARFVAEEPRLDVLVNDAGMQTPKRQLSVDGIELVFATNVLGYFLLTGELLPLLTRSAPSRVVNVASEFAGNLDLDDLQFERRRYSNQLVYRQSKQANRMLTRALARRLEGTGVSVHAMAPGFVGTNLYRHASWWQRPVLHFVGKRFGRSVEEGADTAVWLATSDDVPGDSGGFWVERKRLDEPFADVELEERLWGACAGLVGEQPAAARSDGRPSGGQTS
jgi:NAD(P)-dependent dehydrogenase (short-subunit alcohol dehydrogenase family)